MKVFILIILVACVIMMLVGRDEINELILISMVSTLDNKAIEMSKFCKIWKNISDFARFQNVYEDEFVQHIQIRFQNGKTIKVMVLKGL